MLKSCLRCLSVAIFIFFALGFFFAGKQAFAQSDEDRLRDLERQIEEYSNRINELRGVATSLSNEVAQFDARIGITQLQIDQTEEKISLLTGRIGQIETSLGELTEAFANRVRETYRIARIGGSPLIIIAAQDANGALSRYHYLQKIQQADQDLLGRLQGAQDSYVAQKEELTTLGEELAGQRQVLAAQKSAKDNLLQITRSDERKFQDLLSQSRAEFEAIQAIIAGRGDERESGHVEKGERIASVIQGPSCNSSGGHLHFVVSRGGNTENPFDFLKPIEHLNCSGPGECSAGDAFDPRGSWDWPISAPVRFTQGYGRTWAVDNTFVGRIYQFHNGIDVNSTSNSTVQAVSAGKLFQGSFTGSNGCRLRYVRVDHDENDIDTFYLHINY